MDNIDINIILEDFLHQETPKENFYALFEVVIRHLTVLLVFYYTVVIYYELINICCELTHIICTIYLSQSVVILKS